MLIIDLIFKLACKKTATFIRIKKYLVFLVDFIFLIRGKGGREKGSEGKGVGVNKKL